MVRFGVLCMGVKAGGYILFLCKGHVRSLFFVPLPPRVTLDKNIVRDIIQDYFCFAVSIDR